MSIFALIDSIAARCEELGGKVTLERAKSRTCRMKERLKGAQCCRSGTAQNDGLTDANRSSTRAVHISSWTTPLTFSAKLFSLRISTPGAFVRMLLTLTPGISSISESSCLELRAQPKADEAANQSHGGAQVRDARFNRLPGDRQKIQARGRQ